LRIFPSGKGGLPTPSPDGRRMTIARFRSLTLASIEGNVLFPDLVPSDAGNAMDNSFPKVIWVSDSTRFGIMPGRLLPYYTDSTAAFWAVDAATGDISALGSIDHFTEGGLSPTLEYVGHTRPGKNSHFPEDVTLSRVDGSSSVLLFRGISQFLSFSPDGLHFFYRVGCQPGTYSYCPSDAPPLQFFLGSLDGNSFPVIRPGKWINNSQFVYKHDGGSLRLGDIGGNWTEIAKADYIHSFDAVDLDFQTGGES